jgi:hypothetical protein
MWTYCWHALPTPQTILAVGLDQELLIQLATANCKDCQFKFQNQTRDAKVIRGESDYSLSLTRSHRLYQLCYLLNRERCLYFEHIVQSHCTHIFSVSILKHKRCHVPLKYRCSIDHVWPTYLTGTLSNRSTQKSEVIIMSSVRVSIALLQICQITSSALLEE